MKNAKKDIVKKTNNSKGKSLNNLIEKIGRKRLMHFCLLLIIMICGAVAASLLLTPNTPDLTSVDSIEVITNSNKTTITDTETVSKVVKASEKLKLKDFKDTEFNFSSDMPTIRLMSDTKELLNITVTGDDTYPYIIISKGQNYYCTETVDAIDAIAK